MSTLLSSTATTMLSTTGSDNSNVIVNDFDEDLMALTTAELQQKHETLVFQLAQHQLEARLMQNFCKRNNLRVTEKGSSHSNANHAGSQQARMSSRASRMGDSATADPFNKRQSSLLPPMLTLEQKLEISTREQELLSADVEKAEWEQNQEADDTQVQPLFLSTTEHCGLH